MPQVNIGSYIKAVRSEILLIINVVNGKDRRRFQRVLFIAAGLPFAVYFFVIIPAKHRLAGLDSRLQLAQAEAKHTETYKLLKERLTATYGRLPQPADREAWLARTVRAALDAEGLIPTELTPPVEASGAASSPCSFSAPPSPAKSAGAPSASP